jgi:hypothetical protein
LYTMQTAQAYSTYRGTMENDWANASRVKTMDNWSKFKEKEPEYVVDEVDGVVYRTHKNGKEIYATDIR